MKIKEILLNTNDTLVFLPIRLGVGIVMVAHGAQKLFGWFGDYAFKAQVNFLPKI